MIIKLKKESINTVPVASVPIGLGGQLPPPLFLRVTKKSDIFISFYSGIAVNHAEKSYRFSICPTTFFLENDAPVCCRPGFKVQTLGGEPKNFQTWLSSAQTQQPIDCMLCKARGYLVLGVLC